MASTEYREADVMRKNLLHDEHLKSFSSMGSRTVLLVLLLSAVFSLSAVSAFAAQSDTVTGFLNERSSAETALPTALPVQKLTPLPSSHADASAALPSDYEEFLRSGDWIAGMDGVELEDALYWQPSYSVCDVDSDGVPELIIQLNGCWVVYTRQDGRMRFVATGWLTRDMEISVCPERNTIWFTGGHTSWSFATWLVIRDGDELVRYELEKEDPYYIGFAPEDADPSLKGSYRSLEQNEIMGLELFA